MSVTVVVLGTLLVLAVAFAVMGWLFSVANKARSDPANQDKFGEEEVLAPMF